MINITSTSTFMMQHSEEVWCLWTRYQILLYVYYRVDNINQVMINVTSTTTFMMQHSEDAWFLWNS